MKVKVTEEAKEYLRVAQIQAQQVCTGDKANQRTL